MDMKVVELMPPVWLNKPLPEYQPTARLQIKAGHRSDYMFRWRFSCAEPQLRRESIGPARLVESSGSPTANIDTGARQQSSAAKVIGPTAACVSGNVDVPG